MHKQWRNIFNIEKVNGKEVPESREKVIRQYREYILNKPDLLKLIPEQRFLSSYVTENDVSSLVEKTVKTYGRLDYAFNNARIEETIIPLVEQTSSEHERSFVVNYHGT